MSDPPEHSPIAGTDGLPEYEHEDVTPDFDASPTAWQDTNQTWRKMVRLIRRSGDVIHGRSKCLIGYGPPGIAKTHNVMQEARSYAVAQKQLWNQMEIDDPYRMMRTKLVEGIEEFVVPFTRAHGRITPIRLYAKFCLFRKQGELVILDDVRALFDQTAQNLIQDATDPQGDYKISWETNKNEVRATLDGVAYAFPTEEQFLGGLIIMNNFAPHSAKANMIFDQPLRDRCAEVEFTWSRPDIGIYVDRLAFLPRKDTGLWKYLVGKTFGAPHTRGLGYTGSDGQCIDILKDVRKYYHAHFQQLNVISFRFLMKVLADRVHYPEDWQDMALDHLSDRAD